MPPKAEQWVRQVTRGLGIANRGSSMQVESPVNLIGLCCLPVHMLGKFPDSQQDGQLGISISVEATVGCFGMQIIKLDPAC